MANLERLTMMAEDELTQYSTQARKLEKLRQKIALSVSPAEQRQIREAVASEIPTGGIGKLVAQQRQVVALPFWGIAGLGLLAGFSFLQPLDFLAAVGGGAVAIAIQRWGWKLQARLLLVEALDELETNRQGTKG